MSDKELNDLLLRALIKEFRLACIEIGENAKDWGFRGTLDEALERASKASKLGAKIKEIRHAEE